MPNFRIIFGLLIAAALPAADFTFGTMLRAGLAAGDWEMTTGTSPADTSQPTANAFPGGFASGYYTNGGWHAFEIGYDGLGGFIRLYDAPLVSPSASFITTSYAAPALPAAAAIWTLNSYLRATANNSVVKPYSEVAVNNLALGAGLTVISPVTATAYNANQTGNASPMQTTMSPVSFQSSNAGGAWLITGQVRFVGLSAFTPNGASRSQLQFGLTASSNETPEPSTWLLCGSALAVAAGYRRRRLARI